MSFDTLRAANRLRDEAGFNEVQATVLVDTFAEGFAERFPTKRDLKEVETALRSDMEKMETALRSEIETLATSVRTDMRDLEHRMTIRLGGLMVLGMGVLLTLQRLLP